MRSRFVLLLALVVAPAIGRADGLRPSKDVCTDDDLMKTFEVIEGACDAEHCDESKLGEIDKKVDKPKLMAALRKLPVVHLFWRSGRFEISDVLNFEELKKDQLETLKMLAKGSDDMAVYVLGRGSQSGTADQNKEISRRRTLSVYQYLAADSKGWCRHILKAAFGKTVLPLQPSDATLLDIPGADYEHSGAILNQSVEVIIFPCRNALPIVRFRRGT